MYENLTGVIKLVGISIILVALWIFLSQYASDSFLDAGNIENLLRRTALFSILGIGVAFVIMTGGIDLSLGSLVCLTGCFLAMFLSVDYQPYISDPVYSISKDSSSLLVPQTQRYKAGQWVRLYQTKRTRSGVFQIESVQQGISSPMGTMSKLGLTNAPSRNEDNEDSTAIARLTPVFPISEFDEKSSEMTVIKLGTEIENVLPRDKVWLVNSKNSFKEQAVVQSKSSGNQLVLNLEIDSSIDAKQWLWTPLQRQQYMSVPWAILAAITIALGLGALHGILVTVLRLQPFVVTLCGLLIYRGWSRWLSDDQSVGFGNEYADSLSWFSIGKFPITLPTGGDGTLVNIPYAFFVLVLIATLAIILLNLTIWGRYILALGRNEEAARFSGINTGRMKLLAFSICGLLAGVCGVLFAIEAGSISPSNAGSYFELYAIAAAVLGGCSLRGGEGSILGVIIGTALMQTLNNMIILLEIPDTIELVVLGGVILLGVIADELVRRILGNFNAANRRKDG